jgi:outer membrane immunogenic protein
MKSLSFAAPAVAGAIGIALSAGQASAQPAPSDQYDWTGVYVGLNTGWNGQTTHANPSNVTVNQLSGVNNGTGTVTVPATTFGAPGSNFSSSSWTGGGQVGFQKQSGSLVFGVEGDMDAVGGHASEAGSFALPATGLTTGSTVTIDRFTQPEWTSSIRGRLGWAMGRALFYGTGGLAIEDVRQSAAYGYSPTVTAAVATTNPGATFGPFSNGASSENVLTGWTLGAGGEFALNRAVSLGLEYRYSDYGHTTYNFTSAGADTVSEASRLGLTDNQVLAKINFRFGNGMF